MKKIISHIIPSVSNAYRWMECLFIALILTACGDGGITAGEGTQTIVPRLLSTSIPDGSTGLASTELDFTFTYSQSVTWSNVSAIEIENATLKTTSADKNKLSLTLEALLEGHNYKLTIPTGAVKGLSGVDVEGFTLHFSTKGDAPIEIKVPLATPNAMNQAQLLYNYMNSIYGKQILSGTMADVAWNVNEANLVYHATGKYPAMTFFDYIHLPSSPCDWIDYSDITELEQWWKQGGIIGIGWHWLVPVEEGSDEYSYTPGNGKHNADDVATTKFRPANVMIEGTWENRVAKADLDEVTGYLRLLQDKGIPVVWRPLHEAAGNTYEYQGGTAWFWWGYDGGEVYRNLWRFMFNYLKDKGINNLIWVWTTQLKDAEFYPGDDYVDIIGTDIYGKQSDENAAQYTTIATEYPQKPVALTECGRVGEVSDQWSKGAHWLYYMPWYHSGLTSLDNHREANTSWWLNAVGSEQVITRDELPSFNP